jgi:peroxiredoxin
MTLHNASRALAVAAVMLMGNYVSADSTGQQRAEAAGRGLIGSAAPQMTVNTIDGDVIDLGSLYGKKAVYLKFWATWCVPCREQMPHFEHVYQTAGPDLAVIAVNIGFNDSVVEVQKYRKQQGITMPIVFDAAGQLGAAFNLRVTPQHIVIGRDGRIAYIGHLADQRLDAALLAARSPTPGPIIATDARPTVLGPPDGMSHYGVGDRLPDVKAQTLNGQPFPLRIAEPQRATVLVFLSPWCESYLATTRPTVSANCRAARQQVESLAHALHVRWLGVVSGLWATPEDLQAYRSKYQVNIPLTLDESGAWFREFRVANTPTIIIADAHGMIVRRVDSGDVATLKKALASL